MIPETYEQYLDMFPPTADRMNKAREFCCRKRENGKRIRLVEVMAVGQMPVYWAELAIASEEVNAG